MSQIQEIDEIQEEKSNIIQNEKSQIVREEKPNIIQEEKSQIAREEKTNIVQEESSERSKVFFPMLPVDFAQGNVR